MAKRGRGKILDRGADRRDARIFVIATEGATTEEQYFRLFKTKGDRIVSNIQIVVLPSCDDRSAPRWVLERLDEYEKNNELERDDERWLVLDVERWKQNLTDTCREAQQKGYKLAISNPCFEVWLYLHFQDLEKQDKKQPCKYFKKKLKEVLDGYNPSKLCLELYTNERIRSAISRSQILSSGDSDRAYWPTGAGSYVYRLVTGILDLLASVP